jgi:hypothetical protein
MQGHILLAPVDWFQEISHCPALGGDARNLRVNCLLTAAPDLLFSNNPKLTDLTVDLTILVEEQPINEDGQLPKEAIGCLFFNDPQAPRDSLPGMLDAPLQGWLYLRPHSYAAVWDQIRDGGYVGCSLILRVGPVQNELPPKLWDVTQTLFIFAVSLRFTRRPLANKPSDQAAQPLSAIENASSGFWTSTFKKIEAAAKQKWHA